jgi:hypothetical protein
MNQYINKSTLPKVFQISGGICAGITAISKIIGHTHATIVFASLSVLCLFGYLVAYLIKSKSDQKKLAAKQEHISEAEKAWKSVGQAVNYINGIVGVSKEYQAEIYREACLRHKLREPKSNPYTYQSIKRDV